eukprot:CAMPEP_0182418740 /NCGR_PEP_ID=MMETSP1167-20130531/3116_1 /TAXON_ID=2988 /ORGANISM="Mallomonas Sp, Strain CCMP3275" /LENGTH=523 /DNA_ID=CAMNT_0024593097 /DNA_START=245 /DNA_END=1813 /DNA_ORIENTATION=+
MKFRDVFISLSYSHKKDEPTVAIDDFLKSIDTNSNKLLLKFLFMFNTSKAYIGTFDNFVEFCFALWNIGTIADISLGKYAFLLYRSEKESVLDPDSLMQLMKDAVSDEKEVSLIKRKTWPEGGITEPQFSEYVKSNPKMLQVVKETQSKIHSKIFDESMWRRFIIQREVIGEREVFAHFATMNPKLAERSHGVAERRQRQRQNDHQQAHVKIRETEMEKVDAVDVTADRSHASRGRPSAGVASERMVDTDTEQDSSPPKSSDKHNSQSRELREKDRKSKSPSGSPSSGPSAPSASSLRDHSRERLRSLSEVQSRLDTVQRVVEEIPVINKTSLEAHVPVRIIQKKTEAPVSAATSSSSSSPPQADSLSFKSPMKRAPEMKTQSMKTEQRCLDRDGNGSSRRRSSSVDTSPPALPTPPSNTTSVTATTPSSYHTPEKPISRCQSVSRRAVSNATGTTPSPDSGRKKVTRKPPVPKQAVRNSTKQKTACPASSSRATESASKRSASVSRVREREPNVLEQGGLDD